jgi:hypothetical protein
MCHAEEEVTQLMVTQTGVILCLAHAIVLFRLRVF